MLSSSLCPSYMDVPSSLEPQVVILQPPTSSSPPPSLGPCWLRKFFLVSDLNSCLHLLPLLVLWSPIPLSVCVVERGIVCSYNLTWAPLCPIQGSSLGGRQRECGRAVGGERVRLSCTHRTWPQRSEVDSGPSSPGAAPGGVMEAKGMV